MGTLFLYWMYLTTFCHVAVGGYGCCYRPYGVVFMSVRLLGCGNYDTSLYSTLAICCVCSSICLGFSRAGRCGCSPSEPSLHIHRVMPGSRDARVALSNRETMQAWKYHYQIPPYELDNRTKVKANIYTEANSPVERGIGRLEGPTDLLENMAMQEGMRTIPD